jgi:hypothetical protein
MADTKKRLGWKAVSYGVGALAALATQRVLAAAWKQVASDPPPANMADRQAPWSQAVTWAVATGVGVGAMRLVALRSAARVWEATTHEPPPDVART